MGRLIDEDMLMERLGFLNTPQEREENAGQIITLEDFDSIPTAYDADSVVMELQALKTMYFLTIANTGDKTLDMVYEKVGSVIDKAIETAKKRIVSDDVCERRLCDEEANVYDTSCRNPHILIEGTPQENNYKYCPYCGKKIKVIDNDK